MNSLLVTFLLANAAFVLVSSDENRCEAVFVCTKCRCGQQKCREREVTDSCLLARGGRLTKRCCPFECLNGGTRLPLVYLHKFATSNVKLTATL
eukprot:m.192165 g.192165  ORF g.192165 m.192165 type:complete len:94 (+) comp39465_c0_seq21:2148-2429(+)